LQKQWERSKKQLEKALVCFAATKWGKAMQKRTFWREGRGMVEGYWTHVNVNLKVTGSLVGCFWEEEEEEDEACAHKDGKEVEGPLPA
jgi:hypothetical protein